MAKFFISLGIINKKMLFLLVYIGLIIFLNIYSLSFKYNEVSLFIMGLGFSLGECLTFVVNRIFKYNRISTKKKKVSLKQYLKDYSILFVINTFFMIHRLLPFYFLKNDEENKNKHRDLFINDSLDIIFITLATYFFLKYKYYIHHIISLIFIVIISIIIDLVLENFFYADSTLVIISIVYILSSSFMYAYFKFLMEKKYYHYMDILFIMGKFDTVLFLLSLSIILIVQSCKGTYELIFQFYYYYKEYGAWKMVSIFLVGFIPRGFILFIVEMKTLDVFGPCFVYVIYLIGRVSSTIMSIEGNNRWIILMLSVFQILFSLFYLEIFEYNFCSLNKNTKKNISEREHRNSIIENNLNENDNDDDNDEIEIKGGYDISESLKAQVNKESLKEMNEIFEENENED